MIVSEVDPFREAQPRLAGFAKLTALDDAERLIGTGPDVQAAMPAQHQLAEPDAAG